MLKFLTFSLIIPIQQTVPDTTIDNGQMSLSHVHAQTQAQVGEEGHFFANGKQGPDYKKFRNIGRKALERLERCKAAVNNIDWTATTVGGGEKVLLLPPKWHLVTSCWDKFRADIASKGLFTRRIRLLRRNQEEYQMKRKSAFLVCVALSKRTASDVIQQKRRILEI